MLSLHRILIATAASCSLVPAAAQADVFCVGGPADCSGKAVSTANFRAELIAAQTNGTDDRFVLAAGDFIAPNFEYTSLETIGIVGAGRGATRLRGTGSGAVLEVGGSADSSVSGLTVEGTDDSTRALNLSRATARDVDVVGSAGMPQAAAFLSGGATVERSRVEAPPGASKGAILVLSGSATVRDSDIVAPRNTGIANTGTELTIRGSRIKAQLAVVHGRGHALVTDTFIDLRGSDTKNGASAIGVLSTTSDPDGDHPTADVERVTIVGESDGKDDRFIGLGAQADGNGRTAELTARDTLIHGTTAPIARSASDGGQADLHTIRSSYLTPTDLPFETGPGAIVEEQVRGISPGFVDPAGGDFRLAPGSKLVDRGVTSAPDGTRDADRRARTSDGDGDCSRASDVGAFERQGTLVKVSAKARAGSAVAGTPIGFSADGICTPTAGAAVSWRFDDGSSAEGAAVTHAFATPGTHTATAIVRDAEGAVGESSVTVDVTAVATAAAPRGVLVAIKRKPSATLALPACKKKLSKAACKRRRLKRSAWKVLRGTAKDATKVVVTIKRGRGKAKTFSAKVKSGKWTVKVNGLKTGRTTFTVRAIAADGSTSKAAIRRVGLR